MNIHVLRLQEKPVTEAGDMDFGIIIPGLQVSLAPFRVYANIDRLMEPVASASNEDPDGFYVGYVESMTDGTVHAAFLSRPAGKGGYMPVVYHNGNDVTEWWCTVDTDGVRRQFAPTPELSHPRDSNRFTSVEVCRYKRQTVVTLPRGAGMPRSGGWRTLGLWMPAALG